MTAEVAIANSRAIALAADSAVTIGNQKIYNSAIKLFALSKTEPVGIMIYGNASLVEVPWEVLIKTYRESRLNHRPFDSVREQSQDFIEFLKSHPTAFPEQLQSRWFETSVFGFFKAIREILEERVHFLFQKKSEVSEAEVQEAFSEVVSDLHQRLKESDFSEGLGEGDFRHIRGKLKEKIRGIREQVFERLRISSAIARKLNDIAAFIDLHL